jgi:cysteine-rich repeat protein
MKRLARMRRKPLLAFLLLAACDGGGDAPRAEPDAVGARIATALNGVAAVNPDVITVAHRIHEPAGAALIGDVDAEHCQLVEDALWGMCTSGCNVTTTFYWAHDIPRCSARVEVDAAYDDDIFADVYAIDFAGPSRANPKPSCGDGDVDTAEGEGCDDGNLEAFDGCDPDCQPEPFTGCETVIQAEFSAANIAWVDARTWQSPRSHLMVHAAADAFDPVDAALCDRARTTAQTVCTRLATDMPFVSSCAPEVHVTAASTCDVRLRVWFQAPSPDDGVFTTALGGLLAFTIRD